MSLKTDNYVNLQRVWLEKTGLKPGDRVRVLIVPTWPVDTGWGVSQTGNSDVYQNTLGKTFTVIDAPDRDDPRFGILVKNPDNDITGRNLFPFYVLQKVEDGKE